jgi:hypothetical protein
MHVYQQQRVAIRPRLRYHIHLPLSPSNPKLGIYTLQLRPVLLPPPVVVVFLDPHSDSTSPVQSVPASATLGIPTTNARLPRQRIRITFAFPCLYIVFAAWDCRPQSRDTVTFRATNAPSAAETLYWLEQAQPPVLCKMNPAVEFDARNQMDK